MRIINIGKDYAFQYNISLEGNWINDPKELAKIWRKMAPHPLGVINTKWFILSTNDLMDVDYRVIVNTPPPFGVHNQHPLEKTIVFRMEPDNTTSGRWNEWFGQDEERSDVLLTKCRKSKCLVFGEKESSDYTKAKRPGVEPDPSVKKIAGGTGGTGGNYKNTFLNNCEWHISIPWSTLKRECDLYYSTNNSGVNKSKLLGTVMSSQYVMPGHRFRIDLLKLLQKLNVEIDIYGMSNDHGFVNHKGSLPYHHKEEGLLDYYYTVHAENSEIDNYVTEKLYDAILCETLCFYKGPHIDHINPQSFYRLNGDVSHSAKEIKELSATSALWESRHKYIMEAKLQILTRHSLYARLAGFVGFDLVSFVCNRTQQLLDAGIKNFNKASGHYPIKCIIKPGVVLKPGFMDNLSRIITELIFETPKEYKDWEICFLDNPNSASVKSYTTKLQVVQSEDGKMRSSDIYLENDACVTPKDVKTCSKFLSVKTSMVVQ